MAEDIPANDQKFQDVSDTLEIAEATAKRLSEQTGAPEQDVPQRENECRDADKRWDDAKKRLGERLGSLAERIPVVEKSKWRGSKFVSEVVKVDRSSRYPRRNRGSGVFFPVQQ